MKKTIGRVIDITIPEQYKDNKLLDIMDRTNILFKVMTVDGIKEVSMLQDEENANIMKNDLVEIIEQVIDNKLFTDIYLYSGDDDE